MDLTYLKLSKVVVPKLDTPHTLQKRSWEQSVTGSLPIA